jgi:hypothetical protein
MRWKKMRRQNKTAFKTNNQAIAGIIVAVLILGLIISVISIIQTVYVPKWMEEREAEHMGVIADQFAQFKYSLDNIAVTQSTAPVTTSFTLGSKELGFLSSSRAFGHIQIFKEGWIMQINPGGDVPALKFNIFNYTSQNAYFLDQTYTFETGVAILTQDDGAVMLSTPSISVNMTTSHILTINWSCVDLNVVGSIESIGGYGSYPIQLQFKDKQIESYPSSVYSSPVQTISIDTKSPSLAPLWKNSLIKIFQEAGLNVNTGPNPPEDVNIKIDQTIPNLVTINFIGFQTNYPTGQIHLNLHITTVILQIGPGWAQ